MCKIAPFQLHRISSSTPPWNLYDLDYIRTSKGPDDGKSKIPLNAAFGILKEIGYPAEQKLLEKDELFSRISSARNSQFLRMVKN